MSLPDDLLTQARDLAGAHPAHSRQADLRRAISAAYYALFHLLIAECVGLLSPASVPGLAARIGRAFNHGDMKQVSRLVSETRRPTAFPDLLPTGFSPSLREVAHAFLYLQNQRHSADYDTAATYSRTECQAVIDRAQDAFAAWDKVKGTDEATVFLTALLLHKQWSR